MELQRRLLRAMLWMLGLSAAAGVLAVFMSTRVMGRVAGTALIAAVAIAVAMPISRMLEDEKKRAGGLVGLMSVVLGFIIGLGAVWVGFFSTTFDLEVRLGATATIVAIGGVLAGALLARREVPWARWSVRGALVTDAVGAMLFLIAVWAKSDKPAETAGYLLASGGAASVSLLGLGIEPRAWRWLGVAGALAGLAMGIAGTWFIDSHDPTWYITAMCLAGVVAYAIGVLRIPMGEARFWTLFAAIGSTTALGGCLCALAFITAGFDVMGPEMLSRVTAALGIVSACSTLAVVVMYWLNRRPAGTSAVIEEIGEVQFMCPHCGRRGAAKVGESACGRCGLILEIKVREPRCIKCGYSLLDLPAGACPECGTGRA